MEGRRNHGVGPSSPTSGQALPAESAHAFYLGVGAPHCPPCGRHRGAGGYCRCLECTQPIDPQGRGIRRRRTGGLGASHHPHSCRRSPAPRRRASDRLGSRSSSGRYRPDPRRAASCPISERGRPSNGSADAGCAIAPECSRRAHGIRSAGRSRPATGTDPRPSTWGLRHAITSSVRTQARG